MADARAAAPPAINDATDLRRTRSCRVGFTAPLRIDGIGFQGFS